MAPTPQLREQLTTERDRIAEELERSSRPAASSPAALDSRHIPGLADSTDSTDPADFEDDGRRGRLHELTVALTRMDTGEWGSCAACRAPIEADRLESSPVTTHCGSCGLTGLLQPPSLFQQ